MYFRHRIVEQFQWAIFSVNKENIRVASENVFLIAFPSYLSVIVNDTFLPTFNDVVADIALSTCIAGGEGA